MAKVITTITVILIIVITNIQEVIATVNGAMKVISITKKAASHEIITIALLILHPSLLALQNHPTIIIININTIIMVASLVSIVVEDLSQIISNIHNRISVCSNKTKSIPRLIEINNFIHYNKIYW